MPQANLLMWNNFIYNFNKILMKLCIQNIYSNKFKMNDCMSIGVVFSLSFYAYWKIFNESPTLI